MIQNCIAFQVLMKFWNYSSILNINTLYMTAVSQAFVLNSSLLNFYYYYRGKISSHFNILAEITSSFIFG